VQSLPERSGKPDHRFADEEQKLFFLLNGFEEKQKIYKSKVTADNELVS
jgi:hypothetical protein